MGQGWDAGGPSLNKLTPICCEKEVIGSLWLSLIVFGNSRSPRSPEGPTRVSSPARQNWQAANACAQLYPSLFCSWVHTLDTSDNPMAVFWAQCVNSSQGSVFGITSGFAKQTKYVSLAFQLEALKGSIDAILQGFRLACMSLACKAATVADKSTLGKAR